jgi:hypothetical protein
MTEQIKSAGRTTKRKIEDAYAVIAMAAASAAAVKVATLQDVNGIPFWQIVAGVVLTGVFVDIFVLKNKE